MIVKGGPCTLSSDRINENNLASCLALKIHSGHKRKKDNNYAAIIKRCAHSKYRALKVNTHTVRENVSL